MLYEIRLEFSHEGDLIEAFNDFMDEINGIQYNADGVGIIKREL